MVGLALSCALGSIAPTAQANDGAGYAAQYVQGFPDLPLMPGLIQDPGSVVSFDSPYGRIVQSTATGSVQTHEVEHFYAETLPQLGWQPVLTAEQVPSFRREGEALSLYISRKGGVVTVRFQSSPH